MTGGADDQASELPEHVLAHLAAQRKLTLATVSPGGHPHASTFLYVNDGPILYFWARPESTTAGNVAANPTVGFAVDEPAETPSRSRGVQGSGECRMVLGGDEIVRAVGLLAEKYADTSSDASTANISFFRIVPAEVFFVDRAGGDGAQLGFSYRRERVMSVVAELPERPTGAITAELQTLDADAGDVLVRQGAPADKLFLVVDGEVELLQDDRDGPRTVATLGPGTLLGEMAILREAPRTATVRVTRPTRLMVMERAAYRELVAESLGVAIDFDRLVRDRLDRIASGEGA